VRGEEDRSRRGPKVRLGILPAHVHRDRAADPAFDGSVVAQGAKRHVVHRDAHVEEHPPARCRHGTGSCDDLGQLSVGWAEAVPVLERHRCVLLPIVDDVERRVVGRVRPQRVVVVDRQQHGVGVGVLRRQPGLERDRHDGHDEIRILESVLGTRRRHPFPIAGEREQRFGRPRHGVEGPDLLDAGTQLQEQFEVAAALNTRPHDREPLALVGYLADHHTGDAGGTHLGDPSPVDQRERTARVGVGQHEHAVDVWKSLRAVLLVSRDPLDPGAIAAAEVGGHRVDERVLARAHGRLRRILHEPGRLLPERVFQHIDDLRPREIERLEILAPEHQHLPGCHGPAVYGRAAARRLTPSPSETTGMRASAHASATEIASETTKTASSFAPTPAFHRTTTNATATITG